MAGDRLASGSSGFSGSNDVISTMALVSLLLTFLRASLDALLETGWRPGYRQLQAYHLSWASLPSLYVDVNKGPRSRNVLDYDIGELWLLILFLCKALHPFKQNRSFVSSKMNSVESCFAVHWYLWDRLPCARPWSPVVAETLEWAKSSGPKVLGSGGTCAQLEGAFPLLLSTRWVVPG